MRLFPATALVFGVVLSVGSGCVEIAIDAAGEVKEWMEQPTPTERLQGQNQGLDRELKRIQKEREKQRERSERELRRLQQRRLNAR